MNGSRFVLLVFISLFFCLPASAFQVNGPRRPIQSNQKTNTQVTEDELQRHLSAAETYQISGDLDRAGTENRLIVSIALQRMANIAIRERDLKRGAEMLNEAIVASDGADARTNLALVHLELGETDEGIKHAQVAVAADENNGFAHETLGRLYYVKGDYSAAIPGLEKALILKPDFDAAYTLGMAYLQLKQIDRATLLFEEMLTAVSKKAALHVILGKAYEEANYPLQAEREFRKAIAADPKIAGAHFNLGYTILQHGGSERLSEAAQEFDAELKLSPQDPYSNFLAGVVASSEGDHPKAVRYLQEAVRLNPNIGPVYLFLGQSQAELGQNLLAEKHLRKAIELNRDASSNAFQIRRAHFQLGRLLSKVGRKAEADKELAIAREQQGQLLDSARDEIQKILGGVIASEKPRSSSPRAAETTLKAPSPAEAAKFLAVKKQLTEIVAQAYHNLGVIATQQRQIDGALARFASAAKWKAGFPGLDRNWGIVAFRANQFDKAIAPLSRHIKTTPGDALARRMLGVSYYFSKDHKLVAETLKPIEMTLSADPELAYFYGISLLQLQKQPEAAAAFGRISDQNPKSAQARFYAGQGFVLIGDYERAVKDFRGAAAIDPQMPQVHHNAGQSLIRLNRLDDAENEFRLELQINPSDESSRYHLAYTLLERKTGIDEALALLRAAIGNRYDYADARYQLGKALIEKGEISEAIEQLETAANIEPKKEYIHYQLSIAYRRSSRITDADRSLKLYSELKAANRSDTPAGMGNKKNVP